MRLDRLTNKFQLALADAQSLALGHDNQFIEPLHLMSALLNQEGGSVSPLLTSAGINAGQLRTDINQALNRLPQVEGTGGDVQPSQDLVRVLNLCDKLAQKRGDNFISSELFVLAALESRGTLSDIGEALPDRTPTEPPADTSCFFPYCLPVSTTETTIYTSTLKTRKKRSLGYRVVY